MKSFPPSQPFTRMDQLFEHWALQSPAQAAVVAPGRLALTFAQLSEHLITVRDQFQHLGLGRAARIAVVAPNGPDLALAFLAVASSAICAPLNPGYRHDEFAFYLEDLQASALLIASSLQSPARDVAQARGIPILELIPQPEAAAGLFSIEGTTDIPSISVPPATPDNLALILHTSGTTARPKQVPLTHGNLCASVHHLQQSLVLTPADRCLNLMPLFHIHGLVGALLAAVGSGGSVVCPPAFAADEVMEWLQAFQPTWYTSVPTIHQAILAQAKTSTTAEAPGALRFIRSSSASLPPTVMAELEEVFGVPVIEAYGMTEAAHQMASNPLPPAVRKPGSVGLPAGPEIAIFSETGDTLPDGQVGEVSIRGPNVMTGYRENPKANQQAFTWGWFRTGDQGYVDAEGYLFLTGRLKELINRGGEKIAPVEIDQVLLRHPAVHQAVTFAMPHPTLGEEVGAAVVLHEAVTVTEQELQTFLVQSLADFKIPRRIIFVSEIPKGPTGKVQRIGLDKKFSGMTDASFSDEKTVVFPTNLENEIAALWCNILGHKEVGNHDSFLQLGGDSISAARLISRIRDKFQVEVPWQSLYQEANSVTGLATFIQIHSDQKNFIPVSPLKVCHDERPIPLSFVQEPLWLASQLDPENTAYNRTILFQLLGTLDIPALERCLNEIVRRHEILRTKFPLEPEGPRQIVTGAPFNKLPIFDFSHIPKSDVEKTLNTAIKEEAAKPFDLVHGPVFRSALFRATNSDHRFLLSMHHIVSDGWSDGVLFQEIEKIYNSLVMGVPSPLEEISIQYGDFVQWQQQRLTGEILESQLSYWTQQLSDWRSVQLGKSSKHVSPSRMHSTKREPIRVSTFLTTDMKAFSREKGVTPFIVMLAGFFLLLHRWTRHDHLMVGVPIANRTHPLLERLIGLFAHTLPFCSAITWDQSIGTYIQHIQTLALQAFSHPDISTQELIKNLGMAGNLEGDSLFQVLFVFENAPQYSPHLKDLTCTQHALPGGESALVNFSLFLWDHPRTIYGHIDFDVEYFEPTMIRQLVTTYYSVLEHVVKKPDDPLDSFHPDNLPSPHISIDAILGVLGAETVSYPQSQKEVNLTVFSEEQIDISAVRRARVQDRKAKLSPSKQAALNEKLKKFRRPLNS